MSPLPKRKLSKGRRGRRRNSYSIKVAVASVTCKYCGKQKLSHKACQDCGKK